MVRTVFKDGLFEGTVALITGGGTGIGLRIARELAQLGATVCIVSRKQEHLDQGKALIEGDGGKVIALPCNVRDEEGVAGCIDAVLEQTGRLDFLINNAGGQFAAKAEDINAKGWHAVIDTNLTGVFTMSRETFKRAMKERGGVIINIIANVENGFPLLSHSGAARAGVDNLTKSLAVEWSAHGVRVNAIAPGVIDSSGLDNYGPLKQQVLAIGKDNPVGRPGTEAEIAAGVVFLLSPAAAYITGETLRIDGGQLLNSPFFPSSQHGKIAEFD